MLSASLSYANPVQVVIPTIAGSGGDISTRLFARHLTKHLPKNQSIIIVNMPGAGGIVSSNWLYNVADPENTIGTLNVNGNAVLNALNGDKNVKFELDKFQWLFSTEDGANNVFVLWANTKRGLTRVEQLFEENNTYVIGNQDTGENAMQLFFFRKALPVKSNIVFGYKNIIQALLINEIDARVGTLISAKTNFPQWLTPGHEIQPILQIGSSKRHKDLPNVPLINDYVTDKEHLEVLSFYEKQVRLARLYLAPPKMSKERVKQFTDAAVLIEQDPEYQFEADKLSIDAKFIHHEETKDIMRQIINVDRKVLNTIK
jgi:tripartite-type tricarboxylate transporter receptor subunit TctC